MSWHFSRALVAEYSAANCSDGGQCAPLSGTPTPAAYYWPDKTTGHSRLSRFGMTSEPLTESLGEELLMLFRAGFRARTSAQPEAAQDWTESEADSGQKWPESFAKYDQATRSWRTRQFSLLGGLTEYSETWPRWGSMRNGECLERPMSERHTCESESGLWPTPTCGGGGQTLPEGTTPTGKTPEGRKQTVCLERYVQKVERNEWATPTARDYRSGQASRWDNPRRTRCLNDQVAKFPTPTVAMAKGSSGGALTRKTGKSRENDRLDYAAEGDAKNGRLNPTWVEWLMGWPLGWTELQPLETGKFHEWWRQHGGF